MRKFLKPMALVMAGMMMLAGCGSAESAGSTTASSGTTTADSGSAETGSKETGDGSVSGRDDVVIACEATWTTLDPHDTSTFVNLYLISQMYEALTYVNDSGEIEYVLAEGSEVSEDGKTYTFELKQGVKFHNGKELNAEDVVYSYERAMGKANMTSYVSNITSVTADGDYKVVFTLDHPSASFLYNTSYVYIMENEWTEEAGDKVTQTACGTGAYELTNFDAATETVMTAFADYHDGKPSIETATWEVISDASTAATALETGEIDFMQIYSPSYYANFEGNPDFTTQLVQTLHVALIMINCEAEPFNIKEVRQAMNYLIDKDTMIAVAYEGLAEPAYFMASDSNCPGVDFTDATKYTYDPEKAKELLKQAGYENGFTAEFSVLGAGNYHEKVAQIYQQSCAEVGITLNLTNVESSALISQSLAGEYVLGNMGHSYTADFGFLSRYYTTGAGNNRAQYSNSRVDELFELADKETDAAVRQSYYKELTEILTDDAEYAPVFHKMIPYAWDANLNAYPTVASDKPYFVKDMSWK